jgi:hypothetical protein
VNRHRHTARLLRERGLRLGLLIDFNEARLAGWIRRGIV